MKNNRFKMGKLAGLFAAFAMAMTCSLQSFADGKVILSWDDNLWRGAQFTGTSDVFFDNVSALFGLEAGDRVLLSMDPSFGMSGLTTDILADASMRGILFDCVRTTFGFCTLKDTDFPGDEDPANYIIPGTTEQYDAVFVDAVNGDMQGLYNYVTNSGNVFFMGSAFYDNTYTNETRLSNHAVEANIFLNQVGLGMTNKFLYGGAMSAATTQGYAEEQPYGAALFDGVTGLHIESATCIEAPGGVSGWDVQLFSTQYNGVYENFLQGDNWQGYSYECGTYAIAVLTATDEDGDGIEDGMDVCHGTVSDTAAGVPSKRMGKNRWVESDGDGEFDTFGKNSSGRAFTIEDTAGCSCAQIIAECGYGEGHTKFGCSNSVMDTWTGLHDRAGEAPLQCKVE